MGNLCPFARIGDFKGSPGNWVVGKGGGMELCGGEGGGMELGGGEGGW